MSEAPPARIADALRLPDGVRLRTCTDEDLPFLHRVYAETRRDELAQTGWTAQQQADFIAFQFHAQHHHYITHYFDGEFHVVERDGEDVGRLYLHWGSELRIVDIALLAAARGRGLGSALLQALLDHAGSRGKAVSIHVERNNPALRLYQRLGFQPVDEHGIYLLMRHACAMA